jgi:hypothetical protein
VQADGDHFEDEEERRQMLGGIREIFQQGAADRHLEECDGWNTVSGFHSKQTSLITTVYERYS